MVKIEKNSEGEKDIKTCVLKTNQDDDIKESWSFSKLLKDAGKFLLLLLVVPAFLNYAALMKEEKELKPEGYLIDVSYGQKLFKNCVGKEGSKPTVILDAPLGQTSDVWFPIASSLAKLTRVCFYDRGGLGFSQRAFTGLNQTQKKVGKPHTVEKMVEDFHRLFDNEEKPFVLVGMDLGALVTKFYTQLYQDHIAATILINPIFDNLFLGKDNPWNQFWFESHMPSLQLQHISAAAGITRLGLQTGLFRQPFPFKKAPEDMKKRQKYLRCKSSHMSSIIEESHFLNESLAQARVMTKLRPYPESIPLHLVWTDKFDDRISKENNRVWIKSQEMFEKSSRVNPSSITRLHTTSPGMFFTDDEKISDLIRKAVLSARKKI